MERKKDLLGIFCCSMGYGLCMGVSYWLYLQGIYTNLLITSIALCTVIILLKKGGAHI